MAPSPPEAARGAKFVSGSTMRHVLTMTASSTVGLIAIFIVDFINLYFLSLLGEVEVTAAIGFAGPILFLTISIGIGLSIAASAVVAPAIGRLDWAAAERLTLNAGLFTLFVSGLISALIWLAAPALLTLLGAEGRTHQLAVTYLWIVVPSTPLLALGMCAAAILRSLGDARRSMYVTLYGAIATAILDPILIFGLGLGIEGAAIASVLSRAVIAWVGFYGVARVHRLVAKARISRFWADASLFSSVAIPAILTNVATPVANAYVTAEIAPFGDEAVSAWAIVGRIIPVAFAGVFALTGAIGPILGQNLGAGDFNRVRRAFTDALVFTGVYAVCAWALLALFHHELAALFNAGAGTADLIRYFCLWLTPLFGFLGAQFVANAAFNSLGRPQLSTALNWARATLGTAPFVAAGSAIYGAKGVLAGNLAGAVFFGALSVALCYRHIRRIANADKEQLKIAENAAT